MRLPTSWGGFETRRPLMKTIKINKIEEGDRVAPIADDFDVVMDAIPRPLTEWQKEVFVRVRKPLPLWKRLWRSLRRS